MVMGYSFNFPAMRGVQAGREYYVAMCPLKLLPKLFLYDEAEVPADLRAQRTLNSARIPEIAQYIVNNRYDYVFSAITASIDGKVHFEPISDHGDLGTLIIPMSARFIINDGQHRRFAIQAALEEMPELADETISVVLYLDAGLQRSQQLFADLNKYAVRPTQSLGILYDHRDPLACLSRRLAEEAPCFKGLTDKQKTTISNRSVTLFTLNGIYQATGALLGKAKNKPISDEETEIAIDFWTTVHQNIREWQMAADRKTSSAELRRHYVHVHNVVLHAFGIAGRALVQQQPRNWKTHLQCFKTIDWTRSNPVWEGRAVVAGRMSKTHQSTQLTAISLKKSLGLELGSAEEKIEEKFLASRS